MDHSTVSTPNTLVTLSVDPSVARNTLRLSTRHWAQFFLVGLVPDFSISHRSEHHPTGKLLIVRPLYGPRKEETPLADAPLDALTLCLFKGLGVRHKVVCALSALEANDP